MPSPSTIPEHQYSAGRTVGCVALQGAHIGEARQEGACGEGKGEAAGCDSNVNARPRAARRTSGTSTRAHAPAAALHATLIECSKRASTSSHRCCMAGILVDPKKAVGRWGKDTGTGRCRRHGHLASSLLAASSRPAKSGLLGQTGCIMLVKSIWNAHKESQTDAGQRHKQAPGSRLAEKNKDSLTPSEALCATFFQAHQVLLLAAVLHAAPWGGKPEVCKNPILTWRAHICGRSGFRSCILSATKYKCGGRR